MTRPSYDKEDGDEAIEKYQPKISTTRSRRREPGVRKTAETKKTQRIGLGSTGPVRLRKKRKKDAQNTGGTSKARHGDKRNKRKELISTEAMRSTGTETRTEGEVTGYKRV